MRLFLSQRSMVVTTLLCAGIVVGCSSKSPLEQLADINAEYERVLNRHQEAYDSAATPEVADRAFSELFPNAQKLRCSPCEVCNRARWLRKLKGRIWMECLSA